MAVFQQVTGINAVIYYSDKIFALAGFTTPEQQTHATLIAVGLVNVLATLIAVAWVDRFGRRPLLFAGLIGMTVGLLGIAAAFAFLDKNPTAGGGASAVGIVTLIAMVGPSTTRGRARPRIRRSRPIWPERPKDAAEEASATALTASGRQL